MAEEGPGQDQGRGFEPAGSPETTSPEAQRNQLINAVDSTDKKLGGKVVIRIPISENSEKEVLIFTALPMKQNVLEAHDTIGHLGVHPDLGPIAVTRGQLTVDLEKVRHNQWYRGTEHVAPTWEELAKLSEEKGFIEVEDDRKSKSEVRSIQPDEQQTWDQTFRASVDWAKNILETERVQAIVLPQSLKTAIRIAGELNIPPERRTPPEYAADDPRRADVGGQKEQPADLRPAPLQGNEPQV